MTRPVRCFELGTVPYANALALQHQLVAEQKEGKGQDSLLLLEHPPVFTLGRSGKEEHILASREFLDEIGIEVHRVERGGDVTYHGPGQLVGYPIIDLRPDRCDIHRYVRDLEEVMIATAAAFGVRAGRVEGLTGAWVGQDKLAAIGVRISRWITSHGFALNLTTDLAYFGHIVPCGLTRPVTSMEKLLGAAPDRQAVQASLVRRFGQIFERNMTEGTER